ncbi:VOC family protein [Mucilaginibacter sp.]|uniref:VOC family protein n=1 Tax=Mucilaginibacter sp. TaxID=1882438 RepID=UPI002625432F|nr:VOC family protein [Mucilaginibacter sp.]MDB4924677.1 glyoxalase [Mucilaginibacter sp.]
MESLSPNIFVSDMKATVAFYELLGFKTTMSVPEEGDNLVWVMMANGSVTMMFQTYESLADELPEISRQNGGSLLLYINLKDIRGFYEKIKDKVTVLKGLETTFYGATEFSIKDNNGYVLTFAEHEEQ